MSQHIRLEPEKQIAQFPPTRYMGSKRKLLDEIWNVSKQFNFDSVLDLFSGSGIVSYMYKANGKRVVSNDYMHMSYEMAKALIQNNKTLLSIEEAKDLMEEKKEVDDFVSKTFKGIYFNDEDNHFIDVVRNNISEIEDEYKRAIALEALIRTCIKKRPRGLFTYVGDRYNDGRKDLMKSFQEQFIEAVEGIDNAVFSNGKRNMAYNEDSMTFKKNVDLIYIDPPYYTPNSDNEYVRRYHFVEGLARDWKGVEIQEDTKTKKFKSYPTPFSTKDGATKAFDHIFRKYKTSIIIVSYSSNSLPCLENMVDMMKKYKKRVDVVPIDYRYSFGTRKNTERNEVKEYLFVGYNDGDR